MIIKKIENYNRFPKGEIVLQTLAMPANTNANGNIFGGWIMSQMDIGGAILAKEIAKGPVATVRVDNMIFLRSISVGDIVKCYANCIKTGISSLTINVEIWIKKIFFKKNSQFYCATEAIFIYVAIDQNGKSRAIFPINVI
ncbi:acyl-CoA thioester hydrolase YciA [Buchnera aphidicola]|uniref:acyl-CoA thioester hydrolase YciA n=1 Tax=Buchnera aphidicola TaxID=9 RepID=UPI0039C9C9F0